MSELTWRGVGSGWNSFWSIIPQRVGALVRMEARTVGHDGSGSGHPPPIVSWRQIWDGLMGIHMVPCCGRRVRRVIAPRAAREALVAGGDSRIGTGPRRHARTVLVLGRCGGSGRCRRPEGQRRLPTVPAASRICQIIVGGWIVLVMVDADSRFECGRTCMVVVGGRVIPRLAMRVPDHARLRTLSVAGGQPLGGNVQRTCRATVAGHTRRRRARRGGGGGGRWRHSRRTRHAAVADRCGGTLRGWRGALFVHAVHHGPPRHPGGSPRSGGWGGSGGMNMMVVQGGRGARHGVRDVEDDGRARGSQHRRKRCRVDDEPSFI